MVCCVRYDMLSKTFLVLPYSYVLWKRFRTTPYKGKTEYSAPVESRYSNLQCKKIIHLVKYFTLSNFLSIEHHVFCGNLQEASQGTPPPYWYVQEGFSVGLEIELTQSR